jgi:hypothetical protein
MTFAFTGLLLLQALSVRFVKQPALQRPPAFELQMPPLNVSICNNGIGSAPRNG